VGLQGIEASQSQNKKHKHTIKNRLRGNTRMVSAVPKTLKQNPKIKYPIHVSEESPEQLLLFLL